MTRQTVMLVYGGMSPTHDASVRSARNFYAALDGEQYEPLFVYLDRQGKWWLLEGWSDALDQHGGAQVLLAPAMHSLVTIPGNHIVRAEVIIPCIHDELVRSALEILGIPIAGSLPRSYSVADDLVMLRAALASSQLSVLDQTERTFVVGFIGQGRSARASGIGEVVLDDTGHRSLLTNVELSPSLHESILELARDAFRTIGGCSYGVVAVGLAGKELGVISVDLSLDFTATSYWICLWRAQGIHYPEIAAKLIATARRATYTNSK